MRRSVLASLALVVFSISLCHAYEEQENQAKYDNKPSYGHKSSEEGGYRQKDDTQDEEYEDAPKPAYGKKSNGAKKGYGDDYGKKEQEDKPDYGQKAYGSKKNYGDDSFESDKDVDDSYGKKEDYVSDQEDDYKPKKSYGNKGSDEQEDVYGYKPKKNGRYGKKGRYEDESRNEDDKKSGYGKKSKTRPVDSGERSEQKYKPRRKQQGSQAKAERDSPVVSGRRPYQTNSAQPSFSTGQNSAPTFQADVPINQPTNPVQENNGGVHTFNIPVPSGTQTLPSQPSQPLIWQQPQQTVQQNPPVHVVSAPVPPPQVFNLPAPIPQTLPSPVPAPLPAPAQPTDSLQLSKMQVQALIHAMQEQQKQQNQQQIQVVPAQQILAQHNWHDPSPAHQTLVAPAVIQQKQPFDFHQTVSHPAPPSPPMPLMKTMSEQHEDIFDGATKEASRSVQQDIPQEQTWHQVQQEQPIPPPQELPQTILEPLPQPAEHIPQILPAPQPSAPQEPAQNWVIQHISPQDPPQPEAQIIVQPQTQEQHILIQPLPQTQEQQILVQPLPQTEQQEQTWQSQPRQAEGWAHTLYELQQEQLQQQQDQAQAQLQVQPQIAPQQELAQPIPSQQEGWQQPQPDLSLSLRNIDFGAQMVRREM